MLDFLTYFIGMKSFNYQSGCIRLAKCVVLNFMAEREREKKKEEWIIRLLFHIRRPGSLLTNWLHSHGRDTGFCF